MPLIFLVTVLLDMKVDSYKHEKYRYYKTFDIKA